MTSVDPALHSSLDSGDDLPAPQFMFRTLAATSPDDMYDSDSPADAAPSIRPPSGNIVGASPDDMYDSDSPADAAPSVRPPSGNVVGASPDDMYDSDSPADAAPSVRPPSGNVVGASPDDMYDSDSPADAAPSVRPPSGNVVGASPDDMYDSDSPAEDRAATPSPFTSNQATCGRVNRAIRRLSTPVGSPMTRAHFTTNSGIQNLTRRHRQLLTPTRSQTPVGYLTSGPIGRRTQSVNNSPSPFAHLSQAELDSLIEEHIGMPSKTPHS